MVLHQLAYRCCTTREGILLSDTYRAILCYGVFFASTGDTTIVGHDRSLRYQALEILKMEPNALELKAPIKIVGDLHGQFFDLISMLENCGAPRDGSR